MRTDLCRELLMWLSLCASCDVPGARSLLYGSALGLGGVVLVGALVLRIMDVRSPAELRERMQSVVQPLGDNVRESMSPVKAHMQVRCAPRHVSKVPGTYVVS